MPDVTITITGQDEAGPTLDALQRRLQGVGNNGQRASTGMAAFGRSMIGVGNNVERAFSILTRLDLVQITIQQSTERLRSSQERYAEAVRKHGAGSEAAVAAAQDLADAQVNLEKAQLRSRLSMILVVGSTVSLIAQAPKAITALRAMSASMAAAAAAGGALRVALTGGLAAAGIVAGLVAINAAMGRFGGSTAKVSSEVELAQRNLREFNKGANEFRDAVTTPIREIFTLGGAEDVFEKRRRLERELAEAQERDAQARRDGQQAFLEGETRRFIIQTQNIVALRQEQEVLEKNIATWRERLRLNLGNQNRAQLQGLLDEALGELQEVEDALRGIEDAAADTFGTLNSGLQGMGVNLSKFSIEARRGFLEASGVGSDLAASVFEAALAERALAEAALRTSPALRAQASVTANKDETTEQFIGRLLDLGFTEADLRNRLDLTTRSLRGQEEATKSLMEAQSERGSAFESDLASTTFGQVASQGSPVDDVIGRVLAGRPSRQAAAPASSGPAVGSITIQQTIQGGDPQEVERVTRSGILRAVNVIRARVRTRGGF